MANPANTVVMAFKTQGASRVVSDMKGLDASVLKLGASVAAFNLIAEGLVSTLQGISQYIGESVEKFREFETRMAEVSTILKGPALNSITTLTAGVESLAMKFGQATSDLAKGMYDILSAAFAAEDAFMLLNQATKASIAGLSDVRTSVDIFTTVLNTYGMAVEQASHVSDVLFQSVIRGKFQFQDLGSALQYIVPIAAQAGIRFDELMAALSTTTRHGLRLDMTSRGLALAIQNIINPSAKAAKAARKYGIEMNGLALRVMGLHGWFEELNIATKEFGKSILGELIPNMRSLRVAMVLAGDEGLEGFSKDLQELAKMGNATEIALNKIMNTSQFVANRIQQKWDKTSREVGEAWDRMILDIQGGITSAVGAITNLFGVADYELKRTKKTYLAGGQVIEEIIPERNYVVTDDQLTNARQYISILEDIEFWESERSKTLGQARKSPLFEDIEAARDDRLKLAWLKSTNPRRYNWLKTLEEKVVSIDEKLIELIDTQGDFSQSFMDVVGGIKDTIDYLGDLELTLSNIEIDIEKFEDRLVNTFTYGWGASQKEASIHVSELTSLTEDQRAEIEKLGGTIKGSLAYEYMRLRAEQKYADMSHDVEMGLKMQGYHYKALPRSIQQSVAAVRSFTRAQERNRRATEEMNVAMKKYQLETLRIQLKGMMRRRGLTRGEERRLKKIQIAQTKLRIQNMEEQEMVTEGALTNYNKHKDIIDQYLLKLDEERYQLKYTYDQQIIDLQKNIAYEALQLNNRYEWWEETNQKIIDNSAELITTLNKLSQDKAFVKLLEEYGINVDYIIERIQKLRSMAGMRAGTYVSSYKGTVVSQAQTQSTAEMLKVAPPWLQRAYWRMMGGGLQRGHEYVPYTAPRLVHKGERIVSAGRGGKGGGNTIIVNVNTGPVSSEIDVNQIASKVARAIDANLMNDDGTTNYKMR